MLVVENLCAHVGEFRLKNISFALPEGAIMTLLGPSGSGKTFLLRCIAGFHRLDDGLIRFKGERIDDLPINRRKIGFVFQNYALFPHLDSSLNLGFPLYIKGLRKKTVRRIAMETSRDLDGLDVYMDRRIEELPEGMKQLIAFGRERLHEVEILLLDEPLSQLDRKIHVEMRTLLKRFIKNMGKITIVVFSDPEDAMALGDYLGVMYEGELVQVGRTEEVFENPRSPLVMELTSKLGVNSINVRVDNGRCYPYDPGPVDVEDGDYVLMFRPEEVEISPDGTPHRIIECYFYDGVRMLCLCESGNVQITALLPKDTIGKVKLRVRSPHLFRCTLQ